MNFWSRAQIGRSAGYFAVGSEVHPCLKCSPVDLHDASAVSLGLMQVLFPSPQPALLCCKVPNSRALPQGVGTCIAGIASVHVALPLFDIPLHTQEDSHSINKGEKIIDNRGGLSLALSGCFHFPQILVVWVCMQSVRELEQVTSALGKGQCHHQSERLEMIIPLLIFFFIFYFFS